MVVVNIVHVNANSSLWTRVLSDSALSAKKNIENNIIKIQKEVIVQKNA
jgi:hypothetical protein